MSLTICACTGTPDADHALFEEILGECTAFQLAGALNEEAIREAFNFVTKALLGEGDASPTALSTPAATEAVAQVLQVQQASTSSVAPKLGDSPTASAFAAAAHDPTADYPSIPEEEASAEAGPSHAGRIAAGAAPGYTLPCAWLSLREDASCTPDVS